MHTAHYESIENLTIEFSQCPRAKLTTAGKGHKIFIGLITDSVILASERNC